MSSQEELDMHAPKFHTFKLLEHTHMTSEWVGAEGVSKKQMKGTEVA